MNQVVKDEKMRGLVMKKVGRLLNNDLKKLCRSKYVFSNKDIGKFEDFSWSELTAEIKENAPSLFTILDTTLTGKSECEKHIALGFIASVLVRSVSGRANFMQRMISILMYASHAPKQVIKIIQ